MNSLLYAKYALSKSTGHAEALIVSFHIGYKGVDELLAALDEVLDPDSGLDILLGGYLELLLHLILNRKAMDVVSGAIVDIPIRSCGGT